MNLQEIRDTLDKIKNSKQRGGGTTCKLYEGFGRRCTGACPFVGSFCDLQVIIHSLDEMLKRDCQPDTLKGTQQDCLKSLLRRIQNLEQLQKADSSFIFQSDHQRIGSLETDMKKFREPFIDGTFSSMKTAMKQDHDEIQRIRDHLYAIGRKGKE